MTKIYYLFSITRHDKYISRISGRLIWIRNFVIVWRDLVDRLLIAPFKIFCKKSDLKCCNSLQVLKIRYWQLAPFNKSWYMFKYCLWKLTIWNPLVTRFEKIRCYYAYIYIIIVLLIFNFFCLHTRKSVAKWTNTFSY